MSLIRESLKKAQEDNLNHKSTAVFIFGPKANESKKLLHQHGCPGRYRTALIAGAHRFLYRTGPSKSPAPGSAAAPKPVVVAQGLYPAAQAQPSLSPTVSALKADYEDGTPAALQRSARLLFPGHCPVVGHLPRRQRPPGNRTKKDWWRPRS